MDSENRVDKYGRIEVTITEAIDSLYCGDSLNNCYLESCEDLDLYREYQSFFNFPDIHEYTELDMSVEEFHDINTDTWLIPEEYQKLDVYAYVLSKCSTEIERERVEKEYTLFQQKGLVDILRLLIYIVTVMRDHRILWGVGRGSSVSSYILYLIGVHKVDSIKYELPIEDFLK